MPDTLTTEQWDEYNENGYLRLGKILSDDELKALQQRIDDIMMGKAIVDYSRVMMQLDSSDGAYDSAGPQTKGHKGATLDYRKIQDLEWDPLFLDFVQHPLIEHICEVVYGKDVDIAVFRAMFMNKPSNKGTILPWHQDRWNNLNRDPLVTVWTALDPATIENGCVQVIPKSHHKLINPDHHSGFLTGEMAAEHCKEEDRIFLELEPGETMLLHNWLLHSSDVNRSSQSRRAFSTSYMRADTLQDGKPIPYPVVFGKGALTQSDIAAATAVSLEDRS